MKLSSFVLACLAVIVHETSGELIPGRIQDPRVKRESVLNFQSPTAFHHQGIHMDRLQPARFVRRAHPQPGPAAFPEDSVVPEVGSLPVGFPAGVNTTARIQLNSVLSDGFPGVLTLPDDRTVLHTLPDGDPVHYIFGIGQVGQFPFRGIAPHFGFVITEETSKNGITPRKSTDFPSALWHCSTANQKISSSSESP